MKTERKIWRRLFLNIAIVFMLFAVCFGVAGSLWFDDYYIRHEQGQLRECAQKAYEIDLSNRKSAESELIKIESFYTADISIYNNNIPVYSTFRRVNGGLSPNIGGFDLLVNRRDEATVLSRKSDSYGGEFMTVKTKRGDTYLAYSYGGRQGDDRSVVVMIEQSIINNSASVASQFVLIILSICLLLSLIWCIVFSRRFSRPIEQMNVIARNMAELDFSQKVEVTSDDEIGRLAESFNDLSDSLSGALGELSERNKSLEREIEAERRLDSMRKDFVASVSHELKTPLAIIGGYAEGLSSGMAEDDKTREKYCRIITDEVNSMQELVINLLDLARFESGVDRGDEQVDLAALIINIADKNSAALEAKNIAFSMDIDEREQITATPMLAGHVIQNFLSNAISHTPEGGEIRIYSESYKSGGRVCVYNSGSHIDEDKLESIWHSFYRADGSHNRAEGRYGLGLSIVKAIMQSVSGDFGVFNTESGVVFWAQLDANSGDIQQ